MIIVFFIYWSNLHTSEMNIPKKDKPEIFIFLISFFKNELQFPVAEFKEFERRFKFKTRFKYGWFHLKLY